MTHVFLSRYLLFVNSDCGVAGAYKFAAGSLSQSSSQQVHLVNQNSLHDSILAVLPDA